MLTRHWQYSGFAVVFAEDVPDVASSVYPSGPLSDLPL